MLKKATIAVFLVTILLSSFQLFGQEKSWTLNLICTTQQPTPIKVQPCIPCSATATQYECSGNCGDVPYSLDCGTYYGVCSTANCTREFTD